MKLLRLYFLSSCVCCLLSACGTQPEVTDTEAGPEVRIRTFGWNSDSAQALQTLVCGVRYVPLESTPESFLADITKIIVHNNEIYVKDTYMNAGYGIRVFSEDGRYLRHIGRSGKGPGELIRITDFTIRDSLIYIADGNSEKMAVYTTEGRFLEDISLPDANFASCAALDTGFLWTGDIFYRENPENRYGLYKTDDRLAQLWKREKYGTSSTRALLTEVSDSLLVWMTESSDSIHFYNRQGELIECIHIAFPENHRIPYDKRREVNDMSSNKDFNYYRIGAWNPAILGSYLMGLVVAPGGEWDTFMLDQRTGDVYLDGRRNLIRNRSTGFYPVNDTTFVGWITPDSEAYIEESNSRIEPLPEDVRKQISDGDCALVFYTLKKEVL